MQSRSIVLLLTLLIFAPMIALAQTAATTTVSGTVTDANGAAIKNATVKLTDVATNLERSATTDGEGRYNFYAVTPGQKTITVNAQGFKTQVVSGLQASATTVATVNATLEVGAVGEVVQVMAGVEAQLQAADASIGSVIEETRIRRLPNANRQVNSLFALQPAVNPGGQFAGARNDQSTIQLDGVDVSDNVVGATFRTVIPVPTDTVEELRGTAANANATFGRSAGWQITLVSKRGSNNWHGTAYFYHQDSALAANSWTLNRLPPPQNRKPFLLDNRFGGTFGGPVIKEKTFFFVAYEGRRNPNSATVTRIVPTETFKQGILRFRDASGQVQAIDQNAIRTLDPRGLGVNAKSLEYLRLYFWDRWQVDAVLAKLAEQPPPRPAPARPPMSSGKRLILAAVIIPVSFLYLNGMVAALTPLPRDAALRQAVAQGWKKEDLVFKRARQDFGKLGFNRQSSAWFEVKGSSPPKLLRVDLRQPISFVGWQVDNVTEESQSAVTQ